jgi:hypothetical protein
MLALLENPTGLEAFVGTRARSGSLTCWEWESVFLSLRCTHPDGSESHPCPGQGCFSETSDLGRCPTLRWRAPSARWSTDALINSSTHRDAVEGLLHLTPQNQEHLLNPHIRLLGFDHFFQCQDRRHDAVLGLKVHRPDQFVPSHLLVR